MGCGGSRLNSEQDAIPARIQPLLRNKLDEIRRRRNPTSVEGNTLSKKELLTKVGNKDHDECSSKCESAGSTTPQSRYQSPRRISLDENTETFDFDTRKNVLVKEDVVITDKEFTFQSNCTRGGDGDGDGDDDEGEDEFLSFEPAPCCCKGVLGKNDDSKYIEGIKKECGGGKGLRLGDDEDEDDGDLIYTCPASPSFRVYCHSYNEDENGKHGNDGKVNIAQRQRSRISEAESVDSNEVSVKPIKKIKRGIRFRKVVIIAKTAYSARILQKNIMKVRGCYTPLTSTKSAHLLQQKAAA